MNDADADDLQVREYRLRARQWLAENLRPLAGGKRTEDNDPTPEHLAEVKATQKMIYEAGYAGFTFPVEYGGQGLTLEHERVFLEEATGYDVPIRSFAVSINILGATLAEFGTHEQKRGHVRKILSGEERWLQLLSEPSGGSDLAGLVTTATRDGDSFIVNGQKTWSSRAELSDFALCPVRTCWDAPKHRGISVLIVDLKSPGIEIRRIRQINGAADFCEEFFTDVVVPAADLVGQENEGWQVIRGLLEIEHAWVGRGGSRPDLGHSVEPLVALAKRKGLADDRGVRRQIVDIHVAVAVQKLLSARVTRGLASGKLAAGLGGVLKLGDDAVRQRRAELGLALAGAEGVAWSADQPGDADWSQAFLTSRKESIAGGTDEIQRNNVAERGLGLPREPGFDRDIPFSQIPHN